MIKIKIKVPHACASNLNGFEQQYSLKTGRIWIGRGEDVRQKESQNNAVLSLRDFSKAISRVHACLIISPAFNQKNDQSYPSFYKKLGHKSVNIPETILRLIREFSRPARKIILKDLQSKTGLFQKITTSKITPNSQIILGDNKKIIFQHQQIYDDNHRMTERIQYLQNEGYQVLKRQEIDINAKSFWIVCYKQQKYILRNYGTRVEIGRSSGSDLVIYESSISRKQATLQYSNDGYWTISDGDGINCSSNGTWTKVKKLSIYPKTQCFEETVVKFGDILLTFTLQTNSLQSMKQFCQSTNSSSNSNQKSLQLQPSPTLFKKSSI